MEINKQKLERVASEAKIKAANSPRWINAINKAVEGLLGAWIVTELVEGLLITTENGTYHANGACQCKSYEFGKPCSHRAAAQLVKRMSEVATPATFEQMEAAQIVRPQPEGTYYNGWSI